MNKAQQMMLGSSQTKTYAYVTNGTQPVPSSPHTFSGISLGVQGATRRVVVSIAAATSNPNITAVTIAAVSATSLASSQAGDTSVSLWIAFVPSGATGDIVVTFTGSLSVLRYAVWATYGMTSNTPIDFGTSSASPGTDTLSTVAGGFCISAAVTSDSPPNIAWTNVTEQFEIGVSTCFSGADAATTGANISPTATYSTATDPNAVFVTF